MAIELRNPLAPIIVGSGLNITVLAGNVLLAGVPTSIPNTVVNLTASTTNFVFVNSLGVVSVNTTGFPVSSIPIAQVVTNGTNVTSWIDSRPDFSLPSGSAVLGGQNVLSPAGTVLTNAVFRSIYKNITSTGNIDLYTCPTGKRAIACEIELFNNSSANLSNFYTTVKIGGTYYQSTAATASVVNNTGISKSSHYILEAGETIAVNIAGTPGQPCNVWGGVWEFDNTSNLRSSKITTFIAGDNTVYTVPAGKTATLLPNTFTPCSGASGTLSYGNLSGTPGVTQRTILFNLVPSGGTPGSTNQIIPSTTVANPSASTPTCVGLTMASGDFVSINSDSNAAGQFAFVTVVEI